MMRRFLILALSSTTLAGAVHADGVLEAARASVDADGPLYAYEMTYRDGGDEIRGRVDPSQPEGSRITVLSPEREALSEAFLEKLDQLDEDVDGDIFCDEFVAFIPEDAERVEETSETVRYSFTPQARADADDAERKLYRKTDGEAVLAKADGQVLSFSMSLPEPMKPAMVAKIDTFEMAIGCERTPDGRTFLQSLDVTIAGNAMMQDFSQREQREIIKLLEPVSQP